MSDESLREFQLNGKQLVFLFMASTIVAVVIFLCGVMVGRGVSVAQTEAVTNSTVETGDPTAGAVPELTSLAPGSGPVDVPPDAPGDEPILKYPGVLSGPEVAPDLEPAGTTKSSLSRTSATAVPKSSTGSGTKAPAPPTPSVKATPSAASPGAIATVSDAPAAKADAEPAGTGFVVQVAATGRRSEAESISGRLLKKGYPAFVTTAGNVYRVRVGKYKDRGEANEVAKRLETEERFKPWVTR